MIVVNGVRYTDDDAKRLGLAETTAKKPVANKMRTTDTGGDAVTTDDHVAKRPRRKA